MKPHIPAGGQTGDAIDAEFQNAVLALVGAKSFNFAITTHAGQQPAVHATGSFVAPDRSRLVVGDTERITAGDSVYFRGGAFGTAGWGRSTQDVNGTPDFMATLIAVAAASPVVRVGTAYTFEETRTDGTAGRHWKVWLTSGRVSRVVYRGTSGLRWDESFSDYDGAAPIEPPAATDVHELTATPPCPAGTQSNFLGFCRPA